MSAGGNTGEAPLVPNRPRRLCAQLVVLALFGAVGSAAAQDDPDPQEVPVALLADFVIETASARPGDILSVKLLVRSKALIEAMSIAINFDEGALQLHEVVPLKHLEPANGADVINSSVDIDNSNDIAGNQPSEGWVHIQVRTSTDGTALALDVGELEPTFGLRFRVRPDAELGRSDISFEDIGPVNVLDREVFFKNTITVVNEADSLAVPVAEDGLEGGHINIVGEVGFFMRGDTNYDFERDISDPILTLQSLFRTPDPFPCEDSADANDDGAIDVSDPIYTLIRLFVEGEPFPEPSTFGKDPTPDILTCEAGSGST